MKKLAVALVVLLVVAAAALLVLPSFWDWNGEKGRMAALVKQHTGRDLEIAGDVSLRLLPTPAFAAEQVTLANIDGGSAPAMVLLDELTVSIALLPLLRGEVLVESVTLVKPDVLLEVLVDGRANWRLADAPPAGAAASGAAPDRSGGAQPIRIDSFIVEEGRVRYRDARSGTEETLEHLNAEFAAGSLLGPFAADGTVAYRGIDLAFDANLGQLLEGGATAAGLSLQVPQAEASASFVGALSRHQDLETLRGQLQAEGADLARLLAVLRPDGAAGGGLLARPFTLAGELSASATEAAAESLQVSFGPLSLDGRLDARLGETPEVTARLAAKTLDLDALLAPAEAAAAPATPQGGQAPGATPPSAGRSAAPSASPAFDLPQDVIASLELAADAVVYRGQPLRQLQVAARLEGGRIEVGQASVQLPGSSDLQLGGTVSGGAGGPRFVGTLAADSDNLRGLLRWLGSNPEAVPAERLRRLRLTTGLEVSPEALVLRNTDLSLDVSRLTGGVAIALRERPGLGIALAIDKVNLDAYLPAASPAGPDPGAPPAGGVPAAPDEPGAPRAAGTDPLAVPLLGTFDANLDLRVGQLTWHGLPLDGLRLDATLQQGGLVVRELAVDDLLGSRGSFAGSVASIDRAPSVDGSLDVSVAALSRLTKALGLAAGTPPLESFTLSGAVNGTAEDLRFDQRLVALGGSLRASGRALLPAGAPRVEAAVALDHPDMTVLLRELLRDSAVPAGLGAAAVEGRLSAGGTDVGLSDLQGTFAGIELLDGDLAVAMAGPRPKLTADITAGALPLAALLAPAAAAQGGNGGGKSNGKSAAAARDGGRWSRQPLDLAAFRALDAEVRLSAATLTTGTLRLANARLEATLADGLLEVTRFAADAYGGALAASGRADARDTAAGLQVSGDVKAEQVDLKGLLRDVADSERFSGPVTVESRLATRGDSEAALVAALSGEGRVTGTVTVAAKTEEQAGALLLGLLGQKVREVRGVADSTTVLFAAFAGAPAQLDGTFRMEEGVARSEDLTLRGRNAVARTKATVDLPAWTLDSTTEVFRDAAPQDAYLTARLRGPLDEPNVAVGGQPFQRQPDPVSPAAPDGGEPPADEQPRQQPAKPEELLKDGLKNLLKGLGG
ncbi:MAG: AsmA family protein [Bacteroidota bacterium]|nr:AsmA family protein [Kiloniellaceae bacterium]